MSKLIDFNCYPVKTVLPLLLKDRTTGENIIFATDAYKECSQVCAERSQITVNILLSGGVRIYPRAEKQFDEQRTRQRTSGEVFTPSWVVNQMNNHCDEEWFGCPNQFNTETEGGWLVNRQPVHFKRGQSWKKYVDSRRLEITCGEAPYLVSRYDAVTGLFIALEERIGILDRKLRVVNEKTKTEAEWLEWTCRAFQSVYGYEFQGDNLLIARVNLLLTYSEYLETRWKRLATKEELERIAEIITWNLWQMNGLTKLVPYCVVKAPKQFNLFSDDEEEMAQSSIHCKTYDWVKQKEFEFK